MLWPVIACLFPFPQISDKLYRPLIFDCEDRQKKRYTKCTIYGFRERKKGKRVETITHSFFKCLLQWSGKLSVFNISICTLLKTLEGYKYYNNIQNYLFKYLWILL